MAVEPTEKLVSTETEDGYVLEGAQFTPADGGRARLPIVWMHGFTGRFYEQHTVAIGRRLAARGHVFITGNNRGHDLGARWSMSAVVSHCAAAPGGRSSTSVY